MQREIPGYYYDEEKRKYFKVERAQTAPSSSPWSADVVKRRRIESQAEEEAARRARLVRSHVKRHRLRRDVVASGMLARELRAAPVDNADVGAAAWAGGVVAKGEVPFVPSFARGRWANMGCFYVNGDDEKTGMGVAYASLDEATLVGSYIPMDENGSIHFDRSGSVGEARGLSFRTEMIRCPQMSSISYHQPSHKVILTSREPDHSCGLYFFSPQTASEDPERPLWLLGETSHYQRLSIRHRLRDQWIVHRCTPAPPSSDLLCVIGTNAGILRVLTNESMAWVAPQNAPKGTQSPQEIFDQDFLHGNHNVLLAGGRKPRVWITDLRAREAEWSYIRHASSIAHVKSVNPHQVVVAGLQNTMSLYDIRFCRPRDHGQDLDRATPLLDFPGYRNEAHLHTGWDVSPELGVVASGQDDGTVKLFSLSSGRALRSGPALGGVKTDTPIRAMMFQTMPRERLPSLWVGEGAALRKYSFGTEGTGDEG